MSIAASTSGRGSDKVGSFNAEDISFAGTYVVDEARSRTKSRIRGSIRDTPPPTVLGSAVEHIHSLGGELGFLKAATGQITLSRGAAASTVSTPFTMGSSRSAGAFVGPIHCGARHAVDRRRFRILLITGFGAVLGIAYVVAAGIAREGRAQAEVDERRRAQSRALYLQDPISSRSAGKSRDEPFTSPGQTPTGSSGALRGTVLRRQPASAVEPAGPDDPTTVGPAVAD